MTESIPILNTISILAKLLADELDKLSISTQNRLGFESHEKQILKLSESAAAISDERRRDERRRAF
jgi:hypothetical protein